MKYVVEAVYRGKGTLELSIAELGIIATAMVRYKELTDFPVLASADDPKAQGMVMHGAWLNEIINKIYAAIDKAKAQEDL
jgi:hypothetical protein